MLELSALLGDNSIVVLQLHIVLLIFLAQHVLLVEMLVFGLAIGMLLLQSSNSFISFTDYLVFFDNFLLSADNHLVFLL
jgi:hypothetical protein